MTAAQDTAATGAIDGVSYLALDRVFTGNMTGNVLFIGFGLAGVDDIPVLNNLVALLTFLLGYSSLALGLAVGGIGLLVAGALTSRFTSRTWWGAALRQLAFGAIAAGATYLVGMLIGVSVG